jgi:alpha-galactosidase
MKRLALFVVCLILVVSVVPRAQKAAPGTPLAPTPPMGWNSWDCYGTAVTEAQVKATADVMADKLASFGWQYVVVDIQWYAASAQGHDYKPGALLTLDEYGRLTPALNRFPSAAGGRGFKPLADYVHGKGLKFGIHIMRGIPRQAVEKNLPILGTAVHAKDIADPDNLCRWNPDMLGVDTTRPGSQAYYDSMARLYASWGVDFIKADDMGSHLYQPAEMRALSLAMRASGRPMVLSISPGPAPVSEESFFQKWAHMWRVSDDFWDSWRLLRKQFDYAREWAPQIGVNSTWPDADMLPLGRLRLTDAAGKGTPTRFTPAEQRTVMTFWSIIRSPLIMGGDLMTLDESTLALLTNPEILAVNQRSRKNTPVVTRDDRAVWTAEDPASGAAYVAAFNLTDQPATIDLPLADLKLGAAPRAARDLWERRDLGTVTAVHMALAPHAGGIWSLK